MPVFDVITSIGSIVSSIYIDESEEGLVNSIYDSKYLEAFEECHGIVKLQKRKVESDKTKYIRIKI